jgi:hypothetical protein
VQATSAFAFAQTNLLLNSFKILAVILFINFGSSLLSVGQLHGKVSLPATK